MNAVSLLNAQPSFFSAGDFFSAGEAASAEQRQLDQVLRFVSSRTQVLRAVHPLNSDVERLRMLKRLQQGLSVQPQWTYREPVEWKPLIRLIKLGRRRASYHKLKSVYLRKLEVLEREIEVCACVGRRRQLLPASLSLYNAFPEPELRRLALRILAVTTSPPAGQSRSRGAKLTVTMRHVGRAVGIPVACKTTSALMSSAAISGRMILVSEAILPREEAYRVAVHEVAGHLVCNTNGLRQPTALWSLESADSFELQEGTALMWEEHAALLSQRRLRTIAGRVVAVCCLLDGASFSETVRSLTRDFAFPLEGAYNIAARAHRGGGFPRDVCYLRGWLKVRALLKGGRATLADLAVGRLTMEDIPRVRSLVQEGDMRTALYLAPTRLREHLDVQATALPDGLSECLSTYGLGSK